MKKFFIFFTVSLLLAKAAFAQNAVLNIDMANATATTCHIWIPEVSLYNDYLKKGSFDIKLAGGKSGSHIFSLTRPEFLYLMYSSSDADTSKTYHYIIYLSPGDNLTFHADFKAKGNGLVVTGLGSKNNQPLLSALAGARVDSLYGDSLPNRIIAFANKHQEAMKAAFADYVKLYKPGKAFIKYEEFNLKYDAVYQYYNFKEENKYRALQAYVRNQPKWETIQDSLFKTVKLNNEAAMGAINYTLLISTFLMREKERLWTESYKNPEPFFKQWYHADSATGKKEFVKDPENLLQEKIVNYYFTGRPAEFLYAHVIDDALCEHDPKNLLAIFDDFKQKYPQSEYIKWFGPAIDTVRIKEQQPLTADMVFVADNGVKLNTFDDLLALTKGKTVLLDMWGTWCGPCRNEIHDNGPEIKAYFKGKGLDYFYVANRDMGHEDEWKKLIAYLDMKGTHILANPGLTKDIMAKVKGTGYPTYVIIKKDGTYELSKAGYPMNRDVLIKQLEDALKQ